MSSSAEPAGGALPARGPGALPSASDLLALAKPRITALVVVTAAAGFVAGAGGVSAGGWGLLHLAVGTALLAGGTNALNQLLERREDGRMRRTRDRPLPAGRLSPATAGVFGAALVAGGTLYLLLSTNLPTAGLGLAAAVLYVAAYTPMKKVSSAALAVGAVPGALPVLGGWTAARGAVEPAGLALFGVLFLWQLPHFLALGWSLREDYRRAGFTTVALEAEAPRRSGLYAVLSSLALVPVSVLPALLGTAGWAYAVGAAVLGGAYLVRSVDFAAGAGEGRSREARARGLFRASLLYLPALLLLLAIDAVGRPFGGPAVADLPHLNAGLNATAAVGLVAGWALIRAGRERAHRTAMVLAASASALFLASYLVYHAAAGSKAFAGPAWAEVPYYLVLGSHALLAIAVVPLALVTVARGLADRREAHRGLARWTLPVWLYVSVTGLVVYGALYASPW